MYDPNDEAKWTTQLMHAIYNSSPKAFYDKMHGDKQAPMKAGGAYPVPTAGFGGSPTASSAAPQKMAPSTGSANMATASASVPPVGAPSSHPQIPLWLFGGSQGQMAMPSYQEGTSYVPQTGPAVVHEGEAIIPANQNPQNPQADPAQMYRAWLQAQSQQGTQMGPNMQHSQQQVQPASKERTDYAAQYGPKRAALKDLSNSVQNITSQWTQRIQQRKAMEQQHLFDRFTQSVQGITQSQSEIQQATAALKQNPQDADAAQRLQRAQQSLQQDQSILDSMLNGPHGEKNYKMLSKGFGIDDKNAGTPERQAATQAMKKAMGVGDKAAGILSQLPQTMQLSPDAQRQQMMQRAGVVGKPATQGQVLNEMGRERGQDIQATTQRLRTMAQQGISYDKLQMVGQLKGITVSRGQGGQPEFHVMSPEERAAIPYLKAQDDLTAAKTEAQRAMADAKMNPNNPEMRVKMMDAQSKAVDAQARMLAAQAAQMRAMTAQAKEPPEVAAARKDADRLETEYAKAQQYVATPSPTNDTALIFSYVRAQVAGAGRMTNTEIQQALRSGSMETRLVNMYNRATKGELDPEFRKQIADTIKIASEKARLTADKYDVQKAKEGTPSWEMVQEELERQATQH